jgi:hypothetical protein
VTRRCVTQGANAAASRAHSKPIASESGDSKSKVASVAGCTASGAPVSVVSGAERSTRHRVVAGVRSRFPARSVAVTVSAWTPSASGPARNGEVHRCRRTPSMLHVKSTGSSAPNANESVSSPVTSGGTVSMRTCGGVRSRTKPISAPTGSRRSVGEMATARTR